MTRWFLTAILFSTPLSAAQSPAPAAPSDGTQSASAPAPDSPSKDPSPKKIWTNDNLGHSASSVSVVGDKRGQSQKSTTAAAPKPVDPGTVSRIRQDLQKLQGQLDEVNQKLVSFKNFQEGETITTGDDENSTGYKRTPVNQQMAALQQKKKKLEDQIDALVDEARKKGIEPGQLR